MKSKNFYEMLKEVLMSLKSDPEKSIKAHIGGVIERMVADLDHYSQSKPNQFQVEKIQIFQILSFIAKNAKQGEAYKTVSLDTSKKVIEAIKSINTNRVMKVKLQANQAGLDWNQLQTLIMNANDVKDYQNSVLENKSKIPFNRQRKDNDEVKMENTSITGLLRAKNFLKKGSGNGGGGEGFGPSDYKSTRTEVDRVKNKNYRVMRVQRQNKFSNSRIRNASKVGGAKEKKPKKKGFRVKKVVNMEDSLEKVDIKPKEKEGSGDVQNVFEFANQEEGQNAAMPSARKKKRSKSPLKKRFNLHNKRDSSEKRIVNKRVRTRNNQIDRRKSGLKIKNRFLKVMSHVVDNKSFQEIEHQIEEEATPSKKKRRKNISKNKISHSKRKKVKETKPEKEHRSPKKKAIRAKKESNRKAEIMDLNTKEEKEPKKEVKRDMDVETDEADIIEQPNITFQNLEAVDTSTKGIPINFPFVIKNEKSSPLNSVTSSVNSHPLKTLQARRDSVKSKKSKKFTFKKNKKIKTKAKKERKDRPNQEENFSLDISEEEVKIKQKYTTLNLAKSAGGIADEDLLDVIDYEVMQEQEEGQDLEKEKVQRKAEKREDKIRKKELIESMKDAKKRQSDESVSVLDLYDFEEMNMKQDIEDMEKEIVDGEEEESELDGIGEEESQTLDEVDENEDTMDIIGSDLDEEASDGITLTGEDDIQEEIEDNGQASFRFDLRNSSMVNFKKGKKVPLVNFGYMENREYTEDEEDELEDTVRFGDVDELNESLSSTIDYRAPPVKLFKKTIPKTTPSLMAMFREKHNLRSHLQKVSLRASTELQNKSYGRVELYSKVDKEMARMEARFIKLAKYFPELRSKSVEINKMNYDKLIRYYDSSDRKVEDLWKIILKCLDSNDYGVAFEIALKIENHPFTFLQLCKTTGGQIMRSLDKEINKKILKKLIKIFSKKKVERVQYQFLTGYMNLRSRPVP